MLPALPLLPEYKSVQFLDCPGCAHCLFVCLPGTLTPVFVASKDNTLAIHFVFLVVVLILVSVTDKAALAL